jgi:hypothetical protein
MELGKENTNMTARANVLFEEGYLVLEIVLLAEEPSHATVVILKRADWGALRAHPANVEPALLERLLQAFCLACLGRHFLYFPAALNSRIIHGNYCVLSWFLFPTITFVHIKCTKCIWPE